MRDIFIQELENIIKKDKKSILLTGDLGFKIFDKIKKNYKKQFVNIGVAEQNMIGIATGLALDGFKVFVYSIANFATIRCLEQIRNDAAYHDCNITIIGSGGGFTYGNLGMSHHATEDIGLMRSIPGVKVFAPSTNWEIKYLMKNLNKFNGVKYIRLEKNELDYLPVIKKLNLQSSFKYLSKQNTEVAIVTSGTIIEECIKCSLKIKNLGINIPVISIFYLSHANKYLLKCLKSKKKIFVLEEHNFSCGIGSFILEFCNKNKIAPEIKILSIEDKFTKVVGNQKFLRNINKLNYKNLFNLIKNSI